MADQHLREQINAAQLGCATPRDERSELHRWLHNKSIELLARREHGRAELHKKLQQKYTRALEAKTPPLGDFNAEVFQVLSRLEAHDYLSDERFAQAYVASRKNKGYGAHRIKQELAHKGIDNELIATLLTVSADEQSDIAHSNIYKIWHKKFGLAPQTPKDYAKQQRFLLYRGFGCDDINRLNTYIKQRADESD